MDTRAGEIKLKNLPQERVAELLPDNLILLGYRGSIAHNMYVPQSNPDSIDDKDIMGVYVAPVEHYLGFGRPDVKEKFLCEWDAVSYEVRKFINLLLKCNPNVLSLLWLPDQHIIYEHELGRLLRENKSIFVTKATYHSFNGYAYAQFKRMTHFNQEAQQEMAALESEIAEHGIDINELNPTQAERDLVIANGPYSGERLGTVIDRYAGMKRKYYSGGYMGAKRKELVKKVGFDSKNAGHLIRLLRMGIEFLVEGELHVARADAEQLLAIKRGEWSLERVKEEAERLFKLAEEAYVRSSLPPKPDSQKAEKLCMEIIDRYHGLRL
ncbi:MAG: nucleotidyltransferase domain-containing protein [Blastocatellia bacterium]|nr:nucleotidyltransferase domain-containing protein [Blastocatellia bacterium]